MRFGSFRRVSKLRGGAENFRVSYLSPSVLHPGGRAGGRGPMPPLWCYKEWRVEAERMGGLELLECSSARVLECSGAFMCSFIQAAGGNLYADLVGWATM